MDDYPFRFWNRKIPDEGTSAAIQANFYLNIFQGTQYFA